MINIHSEFDDLIREYIERFAELAGNSRVLVQTFYKKVDKQITKRFEFENKILRKLDKYRYKVIKQDIRREYGWWARFKRWMRGKRTRARTDAECPPTKDAPKVESSALLDKVTNLTQTVAKIQQSIQPEMLEQQPIESQYIEYAQPYSQYYNQSETPNNNVSPLLDNGDTKA